MVQPSLFHSRRPAVSETEVAQLIAALKGRGWRLRRDLERDLGWNERRIRAVAEAGTPDIISSGKGYRLFDEATVLEVRECIAKLKAQANTETARANKYEVALHRRTATAA